MAKYSDSITEAEVGDIVKCVEPESPIDAKCDLSADCTYKVEQVAKEHVHVSGKVLYSYRFQLIKRTGAAPSPEPEQPAVTPEQSPPLVVWPEETPTIYKDLNPGERFVFASSPQVVRMIIDGGNYVITDKSNDPYYNQIGYVSFAEADYPVRRVKYVTAPQFTVI